MQRIDASGNFEMNAVGGGRGKGAGSEQILKETHLWTPACK